jgi:hypothetical protein
MSAPGAEAAKDGLPRGIFGCSPHRRRNDLPAPYGLHSRRIVCEVRQNMLLRMVDESVESALQA